jgi:ABC-type transporter Mla MlaB component
MTARQRKSSAKKRARRPAPARAARRARTRPARTTAPSLALQAACTVAEADSLKAALLPLLAEPRPVTFEVASLQRIDAAGLQLLAAFVRDRRTAGRRVEWRGRSPALEAAAGVLGLRYMLELAGEVER